VPYIRVFFIALYALFIAILTILLTWVNNKGRVAYFLYKIFSKGILFIAGVNTEVIGAEKLDRKGTYLYVSNHCSYFDIPILMKVLPTNVRFVYKKSLTKIPIFGWAMYICGYIPIDRQNGREALKSLRKAASRMKQGVSVVIFPEGTRSVDGNLGEFKKGTFVLADEAKEQVVPVTIIGSKEILAKHSLKIYGGNVKVIIGDALDFNSGKSFLNQIRSKIETNINQYKPINDCCGNNTGAV